MRYPESGITNLQNKCTPSYGIKSTQLILLSPLSVKTEILLEAQAISNLLVMLLFFCKLSQTLREQTPAASQSSRVW